MSARAGRGRYPPALGVGFAAAAGPSNFSTGGCAVYYPANDRYCEPRPFNNVVVNNTIFVNSVTNVDHVNRSTVNRNVYLTDDRFVPRNARTAGVTTASVASFGGRGEYGPGPRVATAYYAQGRAVGRRSAGTRPSPAPSASGPPPRPSRHRATTCRRPARPLR